MKKLIGIFVFMVLLYLLILGATDSARWGSNSFNLGQRIGLSGILCLGAGLLIITGGVDLSIGSVVGLCACAFSFLVLKFAVWIPPYTQGWAEWATPWIVLGVPAFLVMVLGALVGAVNGLVGEAIAWANSIRPLRFKNGLRSGPATTARNCRGTCGPRLPC